MIQAEHCEESEAGRVLVAGVYLADVENAIDAIVPELARSRRWTVEQRWMAIGRTPPLPAVAEVTVGRIESPRPKFALINGILAEVQVEDYAFVIVCDDDIQLPPGFVDRYLAIVTERDFGLSQPARAHGSYIDHAFVGQFDGLTARRTRFVEIGPLFAVRHDLIQRLLPFDEESPMGWGYDLVWPCVVEEVGSTLGIVDAVPVSHSLRRPVAHYEYASAKEQMTRYLASRPHLSPHEAFVVVEAYA